MLGFESESELFSGEKILFFFESTILAVETRLTLSLGLGGCFAAAITFPGTGFCTTDFPGPEFAEPAVVLGVIVAVALGLTLLLRFNWKT